MSENKTLRVLRVEPGKAPVEKEIGADLNSLQAEVEGMIECVYMEDGTILVCNEEGKLNGMAMNRRLADDIICGPFFVVGDDGEGDFASLTDRQVKNYKDRFAQPEQFADYEPNAEPFMRFTTF
jgi:glutamate synthase domain-containing protein 3